MKNALILRIALSSLVALSLFSCNKETVSQPAPITPDPPTTDLQINCYIDGTSTPIGNCLVSIYTNYTDWSNLENEYRIGLTGSDGKIRFNDVENITYYISAFREGDTGGYWSNWNGTGYKTNRLTAGKLNSYAVYLEYKL